MDFFQITIVISYLLLSVEFMNIVHYGHIFIMSLVVNYLYVPRYKDWGTWGQGYAQRVIIVAHIKIARSQDLGI